jgi:diaminopimelate decarboxylase/aspartate kinase
MKFGGTSVAGRPQWDVIASLARARRAEGCRVLLVCSAVAGVTTRLAELADRPEADDGPSELLDLHRVLGRELGLSEADWLPRA